VAGLFNEELRDLFREVELDDLFRIRNSVDGCIVEKLGEAGRRQAFRDDGATSLESWVVERFGVSTPTARALAHVAEKAWDIPRLVGSLCAGEISFDKVRVLSDVATPETEGGLCEQAKECSVRELADVARSNAELARTSAPSRSGSEHDGRYVRFNDSHRTISAQLPSDSYAETKARIDAGLDEIPSEGDTPLDQRRCDVLLGLLHGADGDSRGPDSGTDSGGTDSGEGAAGEANPGNESAKKGRRYLVVAHVPLSALVEESGHTTGLAGELERHGLIDGETVQRIACDATVAIAVDDDVGHTMYEGRAKRFATGPQRREVMRRDRHCRFPGCTNVTFTNVHHLVAWKLDGHTDLDNLALTCMYHHHVVHSEGWRMSGNANEELTFAAPSGRVMTSRPSPLWTRVTALAALAERTKSDPSG
jgi:hypothetical protein